MGRADWASTEGCWRFDGALRGDYDIARACMLSHTSHVLIFSSDVDWRTKVALAVRDY